MNLYQKYLAATQIEQRLEKIGLAPMYVMLGGGVTASISYNDVNGNYLFGEDREAKVNAFLEAFPDVTVERVSEYGYTPKMNAHWITNAGVQVTVDFGSGTCERVQVGTKTVEQYDPEALAAVPMVTVEEPVYEYRCSDDPLRALVSV